MTASVGKPLTVEEATKPETGAATAEVMAWQDAKVRAAIQAADAGDFATLDEVMAIVRKYVPDG